VTTGFCRFVQGEQAWKTLGALEIRGLPIWELNIQDCVTHTAILKSAEKFDGSNLADCHACTGKMLHKITLRRISNRTRLVSVDDAF
jgi:hypothetical protein